MSLLQTLRAPQSHARLQYALNAWEPACDSEHSAYLLSKLGYQDTSQVLRWIDLMRAQPTYGRLEPVDRKRVDAIMPQLLAAAACCPDPDATLRGCLNLLEHLQRWPGYLTVLGLHPSVLSRLVALVGASPWLAQFLATHLELLDELLGERYLCRLPDRQALEALLHQALLECADDEAAEMVALRNFKHTQVLHVVCLDLEGLLSLDEVSKALSDLADVLLDTVLTRVSERMDLGAIPPLGIIGYGKLGSREMTYASDTDIVFVYDDASTVSEATLTRLVRSVNHWLTEPTSAGVLYETDFRLRPYGASGLLVSSVAAFGEYQRKHAWIWEHQALSRARWIAGEEGVRKHFESIRGEILTRHREAQHLRAEVLAMRDRILQSHTSDGDGFNVKHSRGGIIDVEFSVQHLVLRHACEHPELMSYTDNESILNAAVQLGLVPAPLRDSVSEAFRRYRAWMHRERLRGNEVITVSREEAQHHREAVLALWHHIFETSVRIEEAVAA
jgi:[glutamine synthetase] adenylyltransferase / [glutamine synthetase]-adenylyl-L-tyrosine phosphorylase